MSATQVRKNIIYFLLGLYIIYGIGAIGFVGLLFSAAVGLILSGMGQGLEATVAFVILSGIAWKYVVLGQKPHEGFLDKRDEVPLYTGQEQQGIVKRVQAIQTRPGFNPSGILSSQFAEGFADAGAVTAPIPDAGSGGATPTATPTANGTPATPPPATSTPAPTNAPSSTPNLVNAIPDPAKAVAAQTETVKQNAQTSGFTDKLTDGMFKLGAVPADAVGGSHIDVGTTLMNALNSLKPDQVKAMTEDTRKLMETQKSLMGMLESMKPMLNDGKQMMDSFKDMFGTAK